MVERQSAPCKKFVTSVVPFASEPNITARWEMDLSPGMVTSPLSAFTFLKIMLVLYLSVFQYVWIL